ncbi:hypothetical protein GCM10009534_35870 [Kribbella sandramycini]
MSGLGAGPQVADQRGNGPDTGEILRAEVVVGDRHAERVLGLDAELDEAERVQTELGAQAVVQTDPVRRRLDEQVRDENRPDG